MNTYTIYLGHDESTSLQIEAEEWIYNPIDNIHVFQIAGERIAFVSQARVVVKEESEQE